MKDENILSLPVLLRPTRTSKLLCLHPRSSCLHDSCHSIRSSWSFCKVHQQSLTDLLEWRSVEPFKTISVTESVFSSTESEVTLWCQSKHLIRVTTRLTSIWRQIWKLFSEVKYGSAAIFFRIGYKNSQAALFWRGRRCLRTRELILHGLTIRYWWLLMYN